MDREIFIVENTFADTLKIGFQKINPAITGRVLISQISNSKEHSMYIDPAQLERMRMSNSIALKTKVICLYKLSNSRSNDNAQILRLKIRVYR